MASAATLYLKIAPSPSPSRRAASAGRLECVSFLLSFSDFPARAPGVIDAAASAGHGDVVLALPEEAMKFDGLSVPVLRNIHIRCVELAHGSCAEILLAFIEVLEVREASDINSQPRGKSSSKRL